MEDEEEEKNAVVGSCVEQERNDEKDEIKEDLKTSHEGTRKERKEKERDGLHIVLHIFEDEDKIENKHKKNDAKGGEKEDCKKEDEKSEEDDGDEDENAGVTREEKDLLIICFIKHFINEIEEGKLKEEKKEEEKKEEEKGEIGGQGEKEIEEKRTKKTE